MGRLGQRWQALARDDRIALVGLLAMVGGAVIVRGWLMVSYPHAFLGYPDSLQYVEAAALGLFSNTQHPAGYPLFLRLLHHLSNDLTFTIAVQHAMGVATGLVLYKSVRRTGVPPLLGLLPAAAVFFGGTGLFLEHALLSDPLFAFLQGIGVYFTIRALYDPALRWPLLAGIAIGASFWVRTVAISSALLVPILLLCAAPGGTRRRLLSSLTTAFAVIVLVVAYVGIQDLVTGYLGYERDSAWDPYARVATFVNCSSFTPPSGTRFLCPPQPVGHRFSEDYYEYSAESPAVKRLGLPYTASPDANALLQEFTVDAIEHEPFAYAKAIVRGLGFYIFPHSGEGSTPQGLRTEILRPLNSHGVQTPFTYFYSNGEGYSGSPAAAQSLATYEDHTRIQGPLLVILLAAAIIGPWCLPGRTRWAAATFTLTALLSITFAIASSSYDVRYAYSTFGPLTAGAALGAWGIGSFLARMIGQPRRPAAITES
jgi:hypothetical protein